MSKSVHPWYRKRNLLIIFALIVGGFIVYQIYWKLTATPAPIIDYRAKLMALSASWQPEGEDGWPILLEALDAQVAGLSAYADEASIYPKRYESDDGRHDFGMVVVNPFNPDDLLREQGALRHLKEHGVFKKLSMLAKAPRAIRPMSGSGPLLQINLSELGPIRELARACAARMRFAAINGDGTQQAASVEQMLALARVVSYQPFLIDRLVGYATAARTFDEIQCELYEGLIDAETSQQILAALDRQNFPLTETVFVGERFGLMDTIQHIFTDDGHGDGRIDADEFQKLTAMTGTVGGGSPLQKIGDAFHPGRASTIRTANEFYDQLQENTKLNAADRQKLGFDTQIFFNNIRQRQRFLYIMLPALGRVLRQDDIYRMKLASTRIMLALEIYRHEHGELPETLDQLAPGFLQEVPSDPIHDGAFIYRRITDDPDGRQYLLYSTGVDQTDDSVDAQTGKAPTFGDSAFEDGMDVLINQVRSEGN